MLGTRCRFWIRCGVSRPDPHCVSFGRFEPHAPDEGIGQVLLLDPSVGMIVRIEVAGAVPECSGPLVVAVTQVGRDLAGRSVANVGAG